MTVHQMSQKARIGKEPGGLPRLEGEDSFLVSGSIPSSFQRLGSVHLANFLPG